MAKRDETADVLPSAAPPSQLTDAGKYAFAGLAANILAELYNREEER